MWDKVTTFMSSITWTGLVSDLRDGKPGYDLTPEDWELVKAQLASSYFIILTRRKTHLTTYLVGMLTFIKTGKWPQYTHALMNLDLVNDPAQSDKFKLMEATSSGVHYSTFEEVFNCDSVCLLQPDSVSKEDWEAIMGGLAKQLGKAYDNLFDIKDDTHVSCVEMVLDSLRFSPNYAKDFPDLQAQIDKVGNLTPQMYRDCTDFKAILEIKR